MVEDVVVEPMTEEFILWRCLHGGPLSRDTIDQWPPDTAMPDSRQRARVLVGGNESGAVEVIQQLETWKWWYVLRQEANRRVETSESDWQRFGDLIAKPGQSYWLEHGLLTFKHAHPTNLLAHWKKGEKEPWFLATNLSSQQKALSAYPRRMWSEEMFGDMKGNGFDLESIHLRHFWRLSRVTLAVAMLYVWLFEGYQAWPTILGRP